MGPRGYRPEAASWRVAETRVPNGANVRSRGKFREVRPGDPILRILLLAGDLLIVSGGGRIKKRKLAV